MSGFIGKHYLKLWVMMLLGYLPFLALALYSYGWGVASWQSLLTQLTMTNVLFLGHPAVEINPGPFWYFGLMVQVYVVYRLLLYKRDIRWALLLALVCQVLLMALPAWTDYFRNGLIGNAVPFVLGMLYARNEAELTLSRRRDYVWGLLLGIAGVFLCSLWIGAWYWTSIFVCIATVSLSKLLPARLGQGVGWVGRISPAIFIVHPIIRVLTVYRDPEAHYLSLLAYAVITLAVAAGYQRVLDYALGRVGRFGRK